MAFKFQTKLFIKLAGGSKAEEVDLFGHRASSPEYVYTGSGFRVMRKTNPIRPHTVQVLKGEIAPDRPELNENGGHVSYGAMSEMYMKTA